MGIGRERLRGRPAGIAATIVALLAATGTPAQGAPMRKLPARELEQQLAGGGTVHLRHREVTGALRLGEGSSIDARDSVFAGAVTSAGSELPPAGSRGLTGAPPRLGKLDFEHVSFKGEVDLYLLRMASFKCDGCDFAKDVNMHSVETDALWLLRTEMHGFSVFAAAQIKSLNLADAHFDKTADFSGAEIGDFNAPRLRVADPVLITWAQIGDRWAGEEHDWATAVSGEERRARVAQVEAEMRFWKHDFTELDQQRDAREANFQLIKLKRSEDFKPFQVDWYSARVLELGSRYGTRPWRPLKIATVAILLITAVFFLVGFRRETTPGSYQAIPGRGRLPFAFAFSLQTFIPFLTIPGIKDSKWELSQWTWLEPVAGVLGVVLFGLAAYSLTYLL